MEDDEINIIDYIKVVYKYKKLIISLVAISIAFAVASHIITKPTKKMYSASATIMPLESAGRDFFSTYSWGRGGGVEAGKISALLKSKVLAKNVIYELDLLKNIYKTQWDKTNNRFKQGFVPPLERAAALLAAKIDIKNTKEGLLEISIIWDEPVLAAKIVNTYIDKLGDFINHRSLGAVFQSIDPAVPPALPLSNRSKLILSVAIAAVASFFVGVFLSFLIEYLKKADFQSILKS